MYECEKTGLELFESGARVFVSKVNINASAERIFSVLKDPDVWPIWVRALEKVEWTSPKPFGVGTTRRVTMRGSGLKVEEKFIQWEENRQFTFIFTRTTLAVFKALTEDYEVIKLKDGSCEFVWRIAMKPKGLMRPMIWLLSPVIARMNERSVRTFKQYVEAKSAD